jgi:hypothetical protein
MFCLEGEKSKLRKCRERNRLKCVVSGLRVKKVQICISKSNEYVPFGRKY